uniref:Uncharacterized protein n=1 Tax=Rhizophora mucronata TaxID=61149 RepID=A0A2P2IV44_RHIMU
MKNGFLLHSNLDKTLLKPWGLNNLLISDELAQTWEADQLCFKIWIEMFLFLSSFLQIKVK